MCMQPAIPQLLAAICVRVTWNVGMQFWVLFFVEILDVFATLNLFGDNLVAGFLKTQVCNSQSSLLQLFRL